MSLHRYKNREQYLEEQIERSRIKSQYCKVFFSDVIRYKQLLQLDPSFNVANNWGPILCLGVRTGAEVDLFRATFFGPLLKIKYFQQEAARRDTSKLGPEKIKLAKSLGVGGGNYKDGRVQGVELAPEPKRSDIWIGSFDELPKEWGRRFRILYSNSIDHSQDPEKTVAEWKRVAAPGACVILAFSEDRKATFHDPFGGFGFKELIDLWKAPVIFTSETYNTVGYKEICFQL